MKSNPLPSTFCLGCTIFRKHHPPSTRTRGHTRTQRHTNAEAAAAARMIAAEATLAAQLDMPTKSQWSELHRGKPTARQARGGKKGDTHREMLSTGRTPGCPFSSSPVEISTLFRDDVRYKWQEQCVMMGRARLWRRTLLNSECLKIYEHPG